MKDADIFSSYSLRTHPDDADALGDWTSARSCKNTCEERASVAKLTHALLVQRMASAQTTLSWDACGHLLCSTDKAAISSQANQMMAYDSAQQVTPAHLCSGFTRPKRRFDMAALPKRTMHIDHGSGLGSTSITNQPPISEGSVLGASLPVAQIGANRRWIMVKHKGAPHVHPMPEEGDIPLCRRRRGHVGKTHYPAAVDGGEPFRPHQDRLERP